MDRKPDFQSENPGSIPGGPSKCPHGDSCEMFWWRCRFYYVAKEVEYLWGDARQAMGIKRNEKSPELDKYMGDRLDKIEHTLDVMMDRHCPHVKKELEEWQKKNA